MPALQPATCRTESHTALAVLECGSAGMWLSGIAHPAQFPWAQHHSDLSRKPHSTHSPPSFAFSSHLDKTEPSAP